jgi:hypothetical protein
MDGFVGFADESAHDREAEAGALSGRFGGELFLELAGH